MKIRFRSHVILIQAIFGLYVVAQATFLKPALPYIWGALLALGFTLFIVKSRSLTTHRFKVRSLILIIITAGHALAFTTLFSYAVDLQDRLLNCTKIILILFCMLVAIIEEDVRGVAVAAADAALAATMAVVLAGKLGLITTGVFAAGDVVKLTLGFNNPNVTTFFVFSSALAYIFANRGWRLTAALGAAILIASLGALSRTFLLSIVIGWLAFLALHWRHTRGAAAFSCVTVATLCALLGLVTMTLAALAPMTLEPLVGGWLDNLLSLRIESAVRYLVVPNDGIFGFLIYAQDSLYYELVFILGLPFASIMLREVYRHYGRWRYQASSNALLVLTLAFMSGLAETLFLTTSIGSVVIMSLVVDSPIAALKQARLRSRGHPIEPDSHLENRSPKPQGAAVGVNLR